MGKHHRWTAEEKDFLTETVSECRSSNEAAAAFNARFGTNLSAEAVRTYARKYLGVKFTNAKYRKYSAAEKAFIVENANKMTFAELQSGLFRISGRTAHITSVANFVEKTLGVRHGQMRKRHIGAETVKSDGYTYVKIASDPHGGGKNWIPKQRLVYEQFHNVRLGPEFLVIFLNGNKLDFSKENLYAMPRRYVPFMTKNNWWSNDPQLTLTAIRWCELFYAIKEVGSGD